MGQTRQNALYQCGSSARQSYDENVSRRIDTVRTNALSQARWPSPGTGIRGVNLRYAPQLQLISGNLVLQARAARAGRLRKATKRLIKPIQIIQFLGQRVANKQLALISEIRTGKQ